MPNRYERARISKEACITAKGKFTSVISNLDRAMTAEALVTTIESRYDTLRAVWKKVQGKHDAYVKLLPGDELDEKWTEELNQTFSEMEVKTDSYLEESNAAKAQKLELKTGIKGHRGSRDTCKVMRVGRNF